MPKVLNPKASGQAFDEAVIIEAVSISDGIDEEYRYLEKRFGKRGKDWGVTATAFDIKEGKCYDILYLWFPKTKKPKKWKLNPKDPLCDFLYPFYFSIVTPYDKFKRNIRKIRKLWKPKKVKVLFVGESPPTKTFFYTCDSKLYEAMKEAFERARGKKFKLDEDFLKFFRSRGYYLEDLCDKRLNWKRIKNKRERRKKREKVWRQWEPMLRRKIEELKPEKIIVVMTTIKKNVERAVKSSRLKRKPEMLDIRLKFPTYYKKEFIKELSKWLKNNGIC
jgi:hypothetical protein